MKQRKKSGSTRPAGVWNRGSNRGPANPIRVRTKRLDEIDTDKIALAYWLLAKRIVSDESDVRQLNEDEARRLANELDESARPVRSTGSPSREQANGKPDRTAS